MKFIATTSDKLDQIPVKQGQLIFSRDDRVVYLDSDKRTSFQQIITLVDEEQRKKSYRTDARILFYWLLSSQ